MLQKKIERVLLLSPISLIALFFLSVFHSLCHPPPRQGEYDLVELRAVFACAPEAFDLDADGEKKRWREQLVSE